MTDSVRIDKWLWAARFFKTRSLASQAVAGGKVRLNGERIKPAKGVQAGDGLSIRRGDDTADITILELSDRRGPAKVAQTLYDESAESLMRREQRKEERRLLATDNPAPQRRPDKRQRRHIHRFIRKEG